MAKGKFAEWLTEDGLLKLRAWARDGLSIEQIAKNCGIAASTMHEWMNRFEEIQEALRRGREVADIEVENALHKSALGYNAKVRKHFKVRRVEYDAATGKKVREWEELEEAEDEVHVAADVVAQKFWLVNRKPEMWRDKREESVSAEAGDDVPSGVILIPAVMGTTPQAGEGGRTTPQSASLTALPVATLPAWATNLPQADLLNASRLTQGSILGNGLPQSPMVTAPSGREPFGNGAVRDGAE